MADILEPELADYVERLTSPHEALLAELSEETRAQLGSEAMLSGPVAGRLLELLVWFGRPQRVLETPTRRATSTTTRRCCHACRSVA